MRAEIVCYDNSIAHIVDKIDGQQVEYYVLDQHMPEDVVCAAEGVYCIGLSQSVAETERLGKVKDYLKDLQYL